MKYLTNQQEDRRQNIINSTVGIYVAIFSLQIAITQHVSNFPSTILTLASIIVAFISVLIAFSIFLPSHLSAFLNVNILGILWLFMGILSYFGYDLTIVRLFPVKVTGILNICCAMGYSIFFNISIFYVYLKSEEGEKQRDVK